MARVKSCGENLAPSCTSCVDSFRRVSRQGGSPGPSQCLKRFGSSVEAMEKMLRRLSSIATWDVSRGYRYREMCLCETKVRHWLVTDKRLVEKHRSKLGGILDHSFCQCF